MSNNNDISINRKLIETLRKGYSALGSSIQNEISSFILSQQNRNGGFMDRAGQSDLYYSLFGMWLIDAANIDGSKIRLNEFVINKETQEIKSTIDSLALLLLKSQLNPEMEKLSLLSVIKIIFKNGRGIDLSYQFFLMSAVIDACGKNKKLFFFLGKMFLRFYKPKSNMPCSVIAALTYAKNMLGLSSEKVQKILLSYFMESGGFKAFEHLKAADTLSTGVALFALKASGIDLRLLTPVCLSFVEGNYFGGAFLSGDGDFTKDLEYTFYGLLALGSLVNNETND